MLLLYFIALGFMAMHLRFFIWLDNKPVNVSISQGLSTALANIFAIFVEIFLISGLGVAFDQILWRRLRQKSLKVAIIDKLVTLVSSPWNLVRPQILFRAPLVWVIGLLGALVPFAVVFPPGALTVEFLNVDRIMMSRVPTMNLSDYGNGTYRQFVEHSFFEMNGDLSYMNRLNPKLEALASQVLAAGEPVKFDSPCGGSCVYNMSLEGPRFHCKEVGLDAALIDDCQHPMYRAADQAKGGPELYSKVNNSFKLSWYPNLSSKECDLNAIKTLDCSMTLATYSLQITNSLDATRSINTNIDNDRTIWTQDAWIQTQFYRYFFNGSSLFETIPDANDLHTNFTNAQAFAISRAAVQALEGEFAYEQDGAGESRTVFFMGNASRVLGSPYIGLNNRYDAHFNISAKSIERYLEDLVISTISLNMSASTAYIEALTGTSTYVFSGKPQFYTPYAACLGAVAAVYIIALWALCRNGSSAGNSFLQFAVTTSKSKALHARAEECSIGGDENMSKRLQDLEVRSGTLLERADADGGHWPRARTWGFGTETELER